LEEKEYTIDYILKNNIDKEGYGFIYKTTNLINGKKYIGQKKFLKDWKNYLGSGKLFLKAIKKYNKINFNRKIIAVAFSINELNNMERYFIEKYNACYDTNFYNISAGGKSNLTKEIKEKISKSHLGKKLSEETKQKISINSLKMWNNPNFKLIMSKMKNKENNPMFNKKHSVETIIKLRNISLGYKHTKFELDKMSEASKGENNPNSKLKENDVITIKKMILENHKIQFIAKLYNINISAVYKIKNNETWKHIKVS